MHILRKLVVTKTKAVLEKQNRYQEQKLIQ